ncbi:hypothetical protein CLF_112791 [Clonorchis sinensis]|uniref:Uncharacterized protein n=1 Tax=Clonorchis sinensis TaxID=79923 RepID=G7YX02_CLOSI|nr:hypothetical protein CLF_112791 [Clonorchis sinensis]
MHTLTACTSNSVSDYSFYMVSQLFLVTAINIWSGGRLTASNQRGTADPNGIQKTQSLSMAGSVRSIRHTGGDCIKMKLKNEILEKEISIETKELEITKRVLLGCECFDDECSISGDCERGFSFSRQNVAKLVVNVNQKEAECRQTYTSLIKSGDAARI